jgi:glycosyltransferase involved in cell wall biosynthesis
MTIIFFYSNLQPFLSGIVNCLLSINDRITIKIIYFDSSNKLFVNHFKESSRLFLINKKELKKGELLEILHVCNPQIIYLSGWMDLEYIKVTIKYRDINKDVKTVIGIDDIWFNNFRQIIGSLIYKILLKKHIDYMWVSGSPQYHYAKKFGYIDSNILQSLLPANSTIFNQNVNRNKRLVYVGRDVKVKNLEFLLKVYSNMTLDFKIKWPIHLYGVENNNFLAYDLNGIFFHGQCDPIIMSNELKKGGVFILASIFEPWGVVVHELASMGYPLLLSEACGSAFDLLIVGYNGFKFNPTSESSLTDVFNILNQMDDERLENLSKASIRMSSKFSPEIAAYSLLSIL